MGQNYCRIYLIVAVLHLLLFVGNAIPSKVVHPIESDKTPTEAILPATEDASATSSQDLANNTITSAGEVVPQPNRSASFVNDSRAYNYTSMFGAQKLISEADQPTEKGEFQATAFFLIGGLVVICLAVIGFVGAKKMNHRQMRVIQMNSPLDHDKIGSTLSAFSIGGDNSDNEDDDILHLGVFDYGSKSQIARNNTIQ